MCILWYFCVIFTDDNRERESSKLLVNTGSNKLKPAATSLIIKQITSLKYATTGIHHWPWTISAMALLLVLVIYKHKSRQVPTVAETCSTTSSFKEVYGKASSFMSRISAKKDDKRNTSQKAKAHKRTFKYNSKQPLKNQENRIVV